MKMSGNHKHEKDNIEGKHVHENDDDLGKEGLKLLLKGPLKNIPDFKFQKPKSNREKQESKEKRELKKLNKKNGLSSMLNEIENNFEKFQTTKTIIEKQTNNKIPIYIPQYSQPTGNNLNTDTLTSINNLMLEKYNELKQYFETQYNESFTLVENMYNQLYEDFQQSQTLTGQPVKIVQTRIGEPVQTVIGQPIQTVTGQPIQPVKPLLSVTKSEEYTPIQPIEPVKPLLSVTKSEEYTPIQPIEPVKPLLSVTKSEEYTPIQNFNQPVKPILSATSQYEFSEPTEDVDKQINQLLDEFDTKFLNQLKKSELKTDNLKQINDQQDIIIQSKQTQINQLEGVISDLNNELIVSSNNIEKLQKEKEANVLSTPLLTISQSEEFQPENDEILKLQKKKEAEILRLQLENYETISNLEEQIDLVTEQKQKAEEDLITLGLMNKQVSNDYNFEEDILTLAEKQLIKRDIDESPEYIDLVSRGIPSDLIPRNNAIKFRNLKNLVDKKTDEQLQFILMGQKPKTQKDFIRFLERPETDISNFLKKEELKQKQIIDEMVEEMESEELENNLFLLNTELVKIQKGISKKEALIESRKKQLDQFVDNFTQTDNELQDLVTEYESLLFTLETAFENADIDRIEDINQISDLRERENLLALYEYIEEAKTSLLPAIEELQEKIQFYANQIDEQRDEVNNFEIELFDEQKLLENLKLKNEKIQNNIKSTVTFI